MQGLPGSAQQIVADSLAETKTIAAAKKFANTVVSESALYSLGSTLGSLFSGRRLQQQV